MTDYERVMEALRLADAAGASDDARRLAEIARKMRGDDLMLQADAMTPDERRTAQTKNTTMGEYLRAEASRPRAGESESDRFQRLYGSLPKNQAGTGEGVARSVFQGATFGGGDEVVAAGAATLDAIDGAPWSDAYDQRLSREREKIGQFREDSPVLAIGSEVAGAIPTALVPFLSGPRAASMGGRIVSGGATAGAQGAAYGFNAGEGGATDRAKSAGVSGAISAPLGAAAPLAARGVGRFANRLMTGRAAQSAGVSRPAFEIMRHTMSADDSLTGPGAARIAAAGDDAMIADAGPNAMTLLDTAIQRSGPAATIARNAVDDRVTQASGRITGAVDNAFGQPAGIRSTERALRQGTAGARSDAYRAAYQGVIDYTSPGGQQIEQIIRTRVPRAAITRANQLMRAEGEGSRQILARVGDDGSIAFEQLPDVRQIDYITRGLNQVAEQQDGMGKLGGTTQLGNAYKNLSRDLRSLAKDAVPEYADALRTAAEPIAARNALQLGRTAMSPRIARDELAEQMTGMTDAERSFVAQGIRSQIDEALANVKRTMTDPNMDAREAFKVLKDMSSRAAREKVATVIGKDAADNLFRELDQAAVAFEMRAGVASNSATFARTAMDDAVKAQTNDGVVNALRRGEPVNAGKRLTQALLGRTEDDVRRIDDQTYSELVRLLTGPRGQNAAMTLNNLAQANTRIPGQQARLGRLAEELLRKNSAVAAPALQAYR